VPKASQLVLPNRVQTCRLRERTAGEHCDVPRPLRRQGSGHAVQRKNRQAKMPTRLSQQSLDPLPRLITTFTNRTTLAASLSSVTSNYLTMSKICASHRRGGNFQRVYKKSAKCHKNILKTGENDECAAGESNPGQYRGRVL
jgi:hypothetical protein